MPKHQHHKGVEPAYSLVEFAEILFPNILRVLTVLSLFGLSLTSMEASSPR
jgi:hypothetical protein